MCFLGGTEMAPPHGLVPSGICKGPLVRPYVDRANLMHGWWTMSN